MSEDAKILISLLLFLLVFVGVLAGGAVYSNNQDSQAQQRFTQSCTSQHGSTFIDDKRMVCSVNGTSIVSVSR